MPEIHAIIPSSHLTNILISSNTCIEKKNIIPHILYLLILWKYANTPFVSFTDVDKYFYLVYIEN